MLLGILLLLFRRSNNRKSAVVIAVFATALVFGLAHYAAYGSIVQILLVQGLGCIIDVFAFKEPVNIPMVLGIAMCVAGGLVVNLCSQG